MHLCAPQRQERRVKKPRKGRRANMCAHGMHIFTTVHIFGVQAAGTQCAYVHRGQYACRHPPFYSAENNLGRGAAGQAVPVEPSPGKPSQPLPAPNPSFAPAFTRIAWFDKRRVATKNYRHCLYLVVTFSHIFVGCLQHKARLCEKFL